MKIVLTRHGETDWNVERRLQGHTDTVINAHGREQAHSLGEAMREIGITRIVSSTLLRARETAEIVGAALGLPVHFDDRLRETCFGSLEGKTKPEIEKFSGRKWEELSQVWDFRPFGGENREDTTSRLLALLRDLERLHSRETCLVVGHGSAFFGLMQHFGLTPELNRGQYRIIDYGGGAARELARFSGQ